MLFDLRTTAPRAVISAFRERSWRTIAIFRGNSSNAFFLRSTALGRSCILHIEYFIKKCVVMVFNTTELLRYEKAHSLRSLRFNRADRVVSARVKIGSIVINFRIPCHLLASLWMTSMLFVIPRSGLKCKWSGRIFVRVHSFDQWFDWPLEEE